MSIIKNGTANKPKEKGKDDGFDPASLLNIDNDNFFTRIKYAEKKDIDSIVQDYITMLGNSWGKNPKEEGNPLLVYFLFGEIIVSASKIADAMGGDLKKIIPFSLNQDTINEIISSPSVFSEKVKALLAALIEFRNSHAGGKYQSIIVRAKEYIDRNFYSNEVTLYTTAKYVGISPNHLSAVFSKETGENFIEYLTRLRIERAKLLFKTTKMKSIDIAAETGFSDPHYFSYIFKKNTGLSPREFKRKIFNENS